MIRKVQSPPQNLIDYVNGFQHRLYVAGELAKQNLSSVQDKMKNLFYCHAECRVFIVGDQVLALLPITSSPFQAFKFTGPYKVVKKVSEHNPITMTLLQTLLLLCVWSI